MIFKTNRLIYCWNVIDFGFSERVISKLIEYNNNPDENNVVTLLINSSGGNISDAFSIVDVIKNIDIKIRTVATGQVSSAALLLLLSGSKNERYATKNAEFFVHQFVWGKQENVKYEDLVSRRTKEDDLNDSLISFYKAHSKLNTIQVKKLLLGADFYFDSEKALEYGFIDKII